MLGSFLVCSPLLIILAGLAGTGWIGLSSVVLSVNCVAELPSSTTSVHTVDDDDWRR